MKKIWFDSEYIYAETEDGRVMRQSLLWYPALKEANEEQRNDYIKKALEASTGVILMLTLASTASITTMLSRHPCSVSSLHTRN